MGSHPKRLFGVYFDIRVIFEKQTFSDFLHVMRMMSNFRKLYDRGIFWFFARIKYELTSPTGKVANFFALSFYYAANCRKVILKDRKHSGKFPDGVYAVYDLNYESITFDFSFFLASAEAFAKMNGRSKIFVILIQKNNSLATNFGEYQVAVPVDSQLWRFNNIILPLCELFTACVGVSSLSDDKEALLQISEEIVFPPQYCDSYRPRFRYKKAFQLLNCGQFVGFRANPQGLKYVDKWLASKSIRLPFVVITLRQYEYDKSRNSNLGEWIKFAHWLIARGFCPVFVPDTDACWDDENKLNQFIVFREACWNLGLRTALYERAFLNFFYSNGTASLCSLNRKTRYIAMNPVIEKSIHASIDFVSEYQLAGRPRSYEFAKAGQILSWATDDFENIVDEFVAFEKLDPRS